MKSEPHISSYDNNRMLWRSCLAWTWTRLRDADGGLMNYVTPCIHVYRSTVHPHSAGLESGNVQERSSHGRAEYFIPNAA